MFSAYIPFHTFLLLSYFLSPILAVRAPGVRAPGEVKLYHGVLQEDDTITCDSNFRDFDGETISAGKPTAANCLSAIGMIPRGLTPNPNRLESKGQPDPTKPLAFAFDFDKRFHNVPAFFRSGDCGISVSPTHYNRQYEHPPLFKNAGDMYFSFWPQVRKAAEDIVEKCIASPRFSSGIYYIPGTFQIPRVVMAMRWPAVTIRVGHLKKGEGTDAWMEPGNRKFTIYDAPVKHSKGSFLSKCRNCLRPKPNGQ